MEQQDFIRGALIGGVLGGVAALLLAPKSGKEFRDDIIEGYNAVSQKSHEFADDIRSQGQYYTKRGKSILESLNGEENHHNPFLIGGAIGAIIGAVSALLLTPQSGSRLREQLGDRYEEIRSKAEDVVKNFNSARHHIEDRIDDWKDTLVTIVEKLSSGRKGSNGSAAIDEILDWANLGLRLYYQLQKRK